MNSAKEQQLVEDNVSVVLAIHDEVMNRAIESMTSEEIAQALIVLLSQYIPNIESAGGAFYDPSAACRYRTRAIALMEEWTKQMHQADKLHQHNRAYLGVCCSKVVQ